MEGKITKRISDNIKEKPKVFNKKRDEEEKDRTSEIVTMDSNTTTEKCLGSIIVVGKSCNIKSKLQQSTHELHECHSETTLGQISGNENSEAVESVVLPSGSHTSFISAQSDVSIGNKELKSTEGVENLQEGNLLHLENSFSTCVHSEGFSTGGNCLSRLKQMEKKMLMKENKIKELHQKIEECNSSKQKKIAENKNLLHQVNVLNRQLQSMYELISRKSWNKSINSVEFAKCESKTTELELLVEKLAEEKENLKADIMHVTTDLNAKEKELKLKNRELIDYKNRSTLEMCKLINKIDSLKRTVQDQTEDFGNQICEAQNSLDDELVRITTKLEDEYQKDLKSAIEKLQGNFENFSNIPGSTIVKLLTLCESGNVDWISTKQEWDEQQIVLKNKVSTLESAHIEEITQLKHSYENEIFLLKTDIESLHSQLNEKKRLLDNFEKQLMLSKINPEKYLQVQVEDLSSIKNLYITEICSQNEVHRLEMDVFEEKVKMLSDQILYHAKNEENHLLEVNNARKIAFIYREKYEKLIVEWSERVQNNFENLGTDNMAKLDLDDIFDQIKNLIYSLKKLEELYEDRMKNLTLSYDSEIAYYKRDIEIFQCKITDLESFQSEQIKLDETIQELIESIGNNYMKTVEALVTSHMTELGLKQLETYATEKRYMDEIASLKESNKKEMNALWSKLQVTEASKAALEEQICQLNENCHCRNVDSLKFKSQEITVELLKYEGVLAMKEETEKALTERVKELENLLEKREENCRRETESLMAQMVKIKTMSTAKDELANELEEKLSDSEKLLEKSCKDVDTLYSVCSVLEEKFVNISVEIPNDKGDFNNDAEIMSNYLLMKKNGEQLRHRFLEIFDKIDHLEEEKKMTMEKNERVESEKMATGLLEENCLIERMKKKYMEENNKLEKEYAEALEALSEKDKVIMELNVQIKDAKETKDEIKIVNCKFEEIENKVRMLESEKEVLRSTVELISKEKEAAEKINESLQETVRVMNTKMNDLISEMESKKNSNCEPNMSLKLQKLQVKCAEETMSEMSGSASPRTVACQVNLSLVNSNDDLKYTELSKENNKLFDENESLKLQLKGSDRHSPEKDENTKNEVMLSTYRKQLSDAVTERNGWMAISGTLESERERLREEIENLREENLAIRVDFETKAFDERSSPSPREDSVSRVNKVTEMKGEIGRLSNYIRTLSEKLDDMKANNERLLRESNEQLRNNQNLTDELEEAWIQRYEVEDQLTRVRRENVLLNMHRAQLEDTNRRISNLIVEGKPSVVSWIQIHETVESIVDEVLALKTSFDEIGRTTVSCNDGKSQSELRLLNETLNAQFKNKTLLRDELLMQKKTLEKELKNLEELLKKNDNRILNQRRFSGESSFMTRRHSDMRTKNSWVYPVEFCSSSSEKCIKDPIDGGQVQLKTLTLLRNHLESSVDLEELQFRKNLEHEINELNKEIENLELNLAMKRIPLNELNAQEKELALIEIRYEEDVLILMKEFEKEVGKLNSGVEFEATTGEWEEDARERYITETGKIREYFFHKHTDLEKKYYGIYDTFYKKRLNSILERKKQDAISCFHKIIEMTEGKVQEIQLEGFVNNLLDKYTEEIKSIRNKYQKNLIDHASEMGNIQAVIELLRTDLKTGEFAALTECRSQIEVFKSESKKELEENEKDEEEIVKIKQLPPENSHVKVENSPENTCSLKGEGETVNDKLTNKDSNIIFRGSQNNSGKTETNCYSKMDRANPEYVSDHEAKMISLLDETQESEISNISYCRKSQMETDDDKLQITQERDSLKEMLASLRLVVTNLLNFLGQCKDLNNISADFNGEETLYRSLHINTGQNEGDNSFVLNLSNIVQDINDTSLLNSSEHVRFELEKCLKQLKDEATELLQLSKLDVSSQLTEIIRKFQKQKDDLKQKVETVEKTHKVLKEEMEKTKHKFAEWERNLEVVSEGYGEEVMEPQKITSIFELKNKIKMFMAEHSMSQLSQEVNVMEEIWKEGYRLQEEWKKEKIDLEQQIDVADKQLHSLRKFMEEQAAEREQEREAFDREIATLKEILKTKEREGFIQSRTNCENQSVEALEAQVKDLTTQLNNMESSKKSVEIEFQNAVKKIWSLREVIQDLEVQLATVNEKETGLRRKIEDFDALLEEQNKIHADLKNELELCKTEKETQYSNYVKILEEERHTLHRIADQVNPEVLSQMKMRLRQIESMLIKKTKELEMVHVASTNVSCSSPSEDISVRDQWDATRCSTPDEMYENELRNMCLPMEEVDRLHDRLTRHTRAEEIALKYIRDLKMQLKNNRKVCEELETERDLLLERADQHLKENSTLKARLEEQRCNAILQQKQLNVDLECQIKRLEIELEKLNDLCQQKDKQLYDLNQVLENTSKTLSDREAEALNRSKEENALISALKTDLENAISVREKLEENLEKMKGKLQNSLKMPALLDSMLEEKNAEIDRLEKEVLRLSNENSSFLTSSKEPPEQSKPLKNGKRIKFSEPESFGDCISIISPYNPSVIRYCGDSFADFRNSSFKIQQPNQNSKPESLSSIGPLQLSPRGFGINNNWKTSSPVMPSHESLKITTGSSSLEESRFLAVIESKQRETSELKLEIDTYKRQLVERMQELDLAKKKTMVIEQELEAKVEEITQLKNTETHMTLTMDSLKRNHSEEVEELKNKLNFERGKVEKVYEEIKILEVKKIEIEEAFYSLKEDYREKLEGEQKKIKTLTEKIKDLEIQNAHSEKAYVDAREEMKNVVEESKEAMKILYKQLTDLKRENDDLMLTSKNFENAEVQVDILCTRNCRNIINISIPDLANNSNSALNDNFETLTFELEKMTKTITETEFKRCDALAYVQKIKALVSMIFININDVMSEAENQKKKLMETSVDELTDKVERELLLSAKLDNELLSSIEAKGFQSRSLAMNNTQTRSVIVGSDGSDSSTARGNQKNEKDCCSISDKAHLDSISKISELEKENDDLIRKIKDNERVIKCLENNLMTEKERCREDAKIMELLRVNLEKGLQDIKSKDKVLRREMQMRMKLEKELEALKKMSESLPEIRVIDLVSDQVRSQEEKLMSVAKNLDSEKIKNQELRLLLEQNKMERISEKEALRLLECDFNLLKEQKENFKTELLKAKLLLHSRERQINHLKRKVNLQEIDIKALSLSNDIHRVKILHESTASSADNDEMEMREHKNDSFVRQGVSKSLLQKMKKLNVCIERHIQESNEMGEALLHLSEETGQMRDLIKALEENTEVKVNDDTLVADSDLERKLWNLEREKLLKDMETVRCEKELAQRESLETSKTNELLKQENYKLKTEVKLLEKEASSHIEMGVVKDRMSHLLRKYLRAESYRKALIWQKQYLTVSLNSYRSSEETLKKLGKSGSRKKDGKVKSGRPRKFRVITLAVSAIFRMKFIVKRWQRHKSFPTSELPLQSTKETLPASLLSRDNDPGTALSYQSHNSCRQSSTRVLKTPPSRDPGLQRNISDVLQFENYGRRQEPLGTANVLP